MTGQPRPQPPAQVEWRHRRPDVLIEWLLGLGFELTRGASGAAVWLPPITLLIRAATPLPQPARPALDRARGTAADARSAIPREQPNGIRAALAVGWATVDGERTIGGLAGRMFRPAGTDAALGARAWIDATELPALIVLEPRTEGRLAAALARYGEGPLALYLGAGRRTAGALEAALEPAGRWPGGASARLIRPPQPWGPFLLLVQEPAASPRTTTAPGG